VAWCLTTENTTKIKKALKNRDIDPFKLAAMTSLERRTFLEKFVGDSAKQVNALFESKLLLKNQKRGYQTWAKKVAGITPQVRRDLLSRIERMENVLDPKEEEQFLQDLASARLRIDVTQEEAKGISEMSKTMQEAKDKIPENSPIRSKERIEYGVRNALLKEYVAKKKAEARRISFREEPFRKILELTTKTIPDISQTIMTAFDNSYWLRQAMPILQTPRYTRAWLKNFPTSFLDLARELVGQDTMLPTKADVYSRPNALNGKYNTDPNGYGLGVLSEEVYSSEWPAKIPVMGRLIKASAAMFNNAALRLRADIADLEIKAAETAGIDVLDKKEAAGIGSMVTSITGRGSVGGSESLLRKVFWAPRLYMAHINQLTAHVFDRKATPYVRKQAAKNLISSLGVSTLMFVLAKALDPDSVDEKKRLGKIKIWGKWTEMTGGKAAYPNLVMKMTNKVISSLKRKPAGFGERTALDELENFAEGKFSPIASVIRDVLKGTLFGGETLTAGGLLKGRFSPISYQTWEDLKDDKEAFFKLGSMLLELGGANVSTYKYKANWETKDTEEMNQFEEKVGKKKFKQANDDFNKAYDLWYSNVSQTEAFKGLSDDNKSKLTTKARTILKEKTFEDYDFEYEEVEKTEAEEAEAKVIKELKPEK